MSVPIAQGARPPATTAAEPPEEPPGTRLAVPGVEHRPVGGVLVRGAHRELVHVGLAEHRRAGRVEPPHRGRRVGRPVALEDPRAGGGRHALGAEDVLDRDRDAAQRPVRDLVAVAVLDRARGRRSARRRRRPRARRRSTRPAETRPAAISAAASATVSSSSSAHHSACGEGTRKAPSAGSGAGSSTPRAASSAAARRRAARSPARPRARSARPRRGRAAAIRSTCSRIPESSPAIRSTSSSESRSRASCATCRTCSRSITARDSRSR